MLERDVEIGKDLALRHQRDHLVDVRIGVDVVQAHPDAELAELAREIEEARLDLMATPRARRVLDVEPVGRGVLRDDEQFLDAGRDQPLRLAQHVGGRPRRRGRRAAAG